MVARLSLQTPMSGPPAFLSVSKRKYTGTPVSPNRLNRTSCFEIALPMNGFALHGYLIHPSAYLRAPSRLFFTFGK